MPNRYIKETITTSETLAQVSAEAERLFWRLVVLADDYGRYDGRALTILGKGFTAMLATVKAKDIDRWLDELETAGLCRRYIVDNKPYLALSTWDKHQQKRAKTSKYPQPPAPVASSVPVLPTDSVCNQMLADVPVYVSDNVSDNDNESRGAKAPTPFPASNSVSEVFEYYREKVQPNARLIDAARQKIKTRLKTFSVVQLKEGIDRFVAEPWRMENNAREGAAWFFHSDERSEKFLNLVPRADRPSNGRASPVSGKRLVPVDEALGRAQ